MAIKKRSQLIRERESQKHCQANPFFPHKFDTKLKYCASPIILISQKAYNDMYILVDEMSDEIGWLGAVKKEGDIYTIEKIYLLKQQVDAATTILDNKSISELISEIIKKPNGVDEANKMRFWGHSHVEMDVEPSVQDEDQIKLFKKNRFDWFIRGICNKMGSIKFSLFLFDKDIVIDDVPWSVEISASDSRREEIKKEIKSKIKKTRGYYKSNYYDRNYNDPAVRRGSIVSDLIEEEPVGSFANVESIFSTGRHGGHSTDFPQQPSYGGYGDY